ncbi:MAG TPA: RDD family protein [Thermoanaerobaculia bacterium]|jgi:uncharacterized RDD family membrane protein YckC
MSWRVAAIPRRVPEAPPGRRAAPARLWLGATVVDATVVATLGIVVSLCIHLIVIVLPEGVASFEPLVLGLTGALLAGAYLVYAWGYEGATLGQRMLGLRAVRVESLAANERLGMRRALLRLSGVLLGFLAVDVEVAFLRSDRRALHDLIARSVVVPNPDAVPSPIARSLPHIRKGRKYA